LSRWNFVGTGGAESHMLACKCLELAPQRLRSVVVGGASKEFGVPRVLSSLALSAIVGLVSAEIHAQWLTLKTPGIPRNRDGTPNLSAPAPRRGGKPDLTGLWRITAAGYTNQVTTDLSADDVGPSAAALFSQRQDNLFADDPTAFRCLPAGPPLFYGPMNLVRIVQTPTAIVMLYEELVYRQIFMDGRGLPKDPNPSFMGYSVGRWDGDTLVVDSSGFKDTTWLDYGGHPHSEALKMTERIRRTDFGTLLIDVRFEDPTYYKRAWTVPARGRLAADTDMIEYVCNENEKDHAHMVWSVSDARKLGVSVATEILERYVGTYAFTPRDSVKVHVTRSENTLFMDVGGKDRKELVPMSDSTFFTYVPIEFTPDRVIFHLGTGDTTAIKEK
jgi:hypothetical protein